jgi:hypothetical protein
VHAVVWGLGLGGRGGGGGRGGKSGELRVHGAHLGGRGREGGAAAAASGTGRQQRQRGLRAVDAFTYLPSATAVCDCGSATITDISPLSVKLWLWCYSHK